MNNLIKETFKFVEFSKINKSNILYFQKVLKYFLERYKLRLKKNVGISRVYGQRGSDILINAYDYSLSQSLFFKILENRRSERYFKKKINIQELKDFFGVFLNSPSKTKTNYSSAGGLLTIEIFFIALDVDNLEHGVYFFDRIYERFRLVKLLSKEEISNILSDTFFANERTDIDFISASIILLLGNQWGRSVSKYSNRGYRFSVLEMGAVMQSIQLIATAMNLKTCANGGYFDDDLNKLVGYHSAKQNIDLTIVMGK